MFGRIVAAWAGVMVVATAALAQPCGVLPGFAPGLTFTDSQGVNLTINAFAVHDDGFGPALYAGGSGNFGFGARSQPNVVSSIGRLRQGRWEPVGARSTGVVNAILSADLGANLPGGARLFAGGVELQVFNTLGNAGGGVGVSGLAMWNGAEWRALPGVTSPPNVYAMEVFDDGLGGGKQLYVAGSVGLPGQPALVARWNGTTWQPLPQPAPGGSNTAAYDLAVFDDGTGPGLYLAGQFGIAQAPNTGLAKWNGAGWDLLAGPVAGGIYTSVEGFTGSRGPELFVAGAFVLSDDVSQGVARRSAAGTWSGLGVPTQRGSGSAPKLSLLVDRNGPALYVGGVSRTGSVYAGGFLRYDGTNVVTPVRTYASFFGTFSSGPGYTGPAAVFDAGQGPEVWIGGSFAAFSNTVAINPLGMPTRSLLRIPQSGPSAGEVREGGTGVSWPASSGNYRPAMQKVTIAGREQLAFLGQVYGGGGAPSAGYALFDGQSWTTDPTVNGQVYTAASAALVDGVERLILAPFSGPVGYLLPGATSLTPYGNGANALSDVRTMLYFDDGTTGGPVLYAQNQTSVRRLVNGQWQVIFTGTTLSMIVGDLGEGPRLLIGAGLLGGSGVGVWNGSIFERVGPFVAFPLAPTALAVHDDGDGPRLYVGFEGSSTLGGTQTINRVARLNGNVWEPLGLGIVGSNGVRLALASFDDGSGAALYVAGEFVRAGAGPSRGFARWRRGGWEPVYDINQRTFTGSPSAELSLAVLGDTLFLAGVFADTGLRLAGGATSSANNVIVGENLVAIRRCPPACFPDLNRDGNEDAGDIDYLVHVAAGGANPAGTRTDLNQDGLTDAWDVDVLIDVIAGGACN